MTRRGISMLIALGVVLTIVAALIVFFNLPYSPMKSDFVKDLQSLSGAQEAVGQDVFTEEDISSLPAPVARYFRHCGFIGKPKMSYMRAVFNNVNFLQGKNGPVLKIDYTQYNFTKKPDRIALIESSMFGIPFDGYDSYIDGTGGMKGVVAKLVTIFDQKGSEMDKAALVTYLAECFLIPNVALQDFIIWEEIDDTHAKATITYYGISASGEFAFNELGEMVSFTTEDRAMYNTDGSIEYIKWSAICGDYTDQNGYLLPTTLQGVWHYDDGDKMYFDGRNARIEYYY